MKIKLLDTKVKKLFVADSGFHIAFLSLTSGLFLNGLAYYMGADEHDILVAYLGVIMNVCGVLTVLFLPLLGKAKSAKKLTIGLTIFSKTLSFLIVFIPLLLPRELWLYLFVPIITIAFTTQALTTVSVYNWMMFFVESPIRGRYVALRQTITLLIQTILPILGGYILDGTEQEYIGFLVVFCFAFMMTIIEIGLLLKINDAGKIMSESDKMKVSEAIKNTFKNKPFLGYIFYLFFFEFILFFSDSMLHFYFLTYLKLDFAEVSAFFIMMTLPQVFLLPLWGKIADKIGHERSLYYTIFFFMGESLFLGLSNLNNYTVCILLSFAVSSIANAGWNVAMWTRRYELIPEKGRMMYDSIATMAMGGGLLLGALCGGLAKQGIEINNHLVSLMDFAEIRILFFITMSGIFLMQIIYAVVRRIYKHKMFIKASVN